MLEVTDNVFRVKSQDEFTSPFIVDPEYLKHQHDSAHGMPDYRHWHISCGRRFRALKLWFVIRMHGISGLQDNIRKQVQLGNYFADLVIKEPRLQLVTNNMGVVSFRSKVSLKGLDFASHTLYIGLLLGAESSHRITFAKNKFYKKDPRGSHKN